MQKKFRRNAEQLSIKIFVRRAELVLMFVRAEQLKFFAEVFQLSMKKFASVAENAQKNVLLLQLLWR